MYETDFNNFFIEKGEYFADEETLVSVIQKTETTYSIISFFDEYKIKKFTGKEKLEKFLKKEMVRIPFSKKMILKILANL